MGRSNRHPRRRRPTTNRNSAGKAPAAAWRKTPPPVPSWASPSWPPTPTATPLTYALAGSNAFAIDAGTGQISVAAGAALDYETQASYALTVTVSDGKDKPKAMPTAGRTTPSR